jgi:F-type H+-transporting ATPase subunit b
MEFLNDTNIVVSIAFVAFVGVLLYLGVPKIVAKLLDGRADGIKRDLDEAKALRDEARAILDSYEAKQKAVAGQAAAIVASAKEEAVNAAAAAKEDLAATIARRVQAAKDQIASAETAAIRQIKDQAAAVAVAAARDVIAKGINAETGNGLIDAAIADVGAKLH